MSRVRRVLIAALSFAVPSAVAAGGISAESPKGPPSWRAAGLAAHSELPVAELPPVDRDRLEAEDAIASVLPEKSLRVGLPVKVDIEPSRDGLWERLSGGDQVWRLRVRSRDALWLVLGFGTFRPVEEAALWVYSEDRELLYGPYTSGDVKRHGQLWIPPLAGESVIVELRWPGALDVERPNIHLGIVSHGYRPFGPVGKHHTGHDNTADACNIDVNCPEGAAWEAQKRSVVNLLTDLGSQYCAGSLITNTEGDCRNFVLTAHHCADTQADAVSTTFQFNYERPGCNSGDAPTTHQISGADLRATYSVSDVTLFEMTSDPLAAWDAFYNGWSRSATAATESTCIHHPQGDVKKISFNTDPLVNGVNYNVDHWRVTEWENGTTEDGSSGAPLFDQNKRVVGQLHGGTASCTSITWDEFGKFDVSWEGGGTAASRLRDWLDPGNTGAITTDGVELSVCQTPRPKLEFDSFVADDTSGNGNGIVDPGETITLQVLELNSGTLDATGVTGTLSTSTPLVSIGDAAADWPTIPQQEIRASVAPHFSLTPDAGFVCGDPIELQLTMNATEGPGVWNQEFTVPTGDPVLTTDFSDDMETGVNGFVTEEVSGANPWSQTTADASSPVTSWFVADIDTTSESRLIMPELTSLPANAELTFQHRVNTEASWDGGVLEYTTDGSTWLDAGSLIVEGGYLGGIGGSAVSPLAGRSAWTGDTGGWVLVRADLSTLAGQNVSFRWRFATDDSTADEGWYVDDVVVESTSYDCSPPIAPPGAAADPDGFTIAKDPGGYLLTWAAPTTGGPVDGYHLYRTDLASGPPAQPVCEADLGSGLSIVLPTLTDAQGFLVAAHNAAGVGSLGKDYAGDERPAPSPADACP